MVLRATQAFSVDDHRGTPRIFTTGSLVQDDDPVIKGREHLFEPVEATVQKQARVTSVERATAAPGEKRTLTSPAKPARGRRGPRQPKDKPAEKPADQES